MVSKYKRKTTQRYSSQNMTLAACRNQPVSNITAKAFRGVLGARWSLSCDHDWTFRYYSQNCEASRYWQSRANGLQILFWIVIILTRVSFFDTHIACCCFGCYANHVQNCCNLCSIIVLFLIVQISMLPVCLTRSLWNKIIFETQVLYFT